MITKMNPNSGPCVSGSSPSKNITLMLSSSHVLALHSSNESKTIETTRKNNKLQGCHSIYTWRNNRM